MLTQQTATKQVGRLSNRQLNTLVSLIKVMPNEDLKNLMADLQQKENWAIKRLYDYVFYSEYGLMPSEDCQLPITEQVLKYPAMRYVVQLMEELQQ